MPDWQAIKRSELVRVGWMGIRMQEEMNQPTATNQPSTNCNQPTTNRNQLTNQPINHKPQPTN